MSAKRRTRLFAGFFALTLIVSNIAYGIPFDALIRSWNRSKIIDQTYLAMTGQQKPQFSTFTNTADAANFSMQTGYYVGNGATQTISGVGFQPEMVIIKADTSASAAVFKTSAMSANNTAYFAATANSTGTLITFTATGFTVANNAATNTANVRYTWTAFRGSDCTSTGTICVGTYTGNGTNPRTITTGFQPAFVMAKRTTAVAASFRTSSMAANVGQYFTTTAQDTTGTLFGTISTTGFTVGATNNTSGGTYYYVAFKSVAGVMSVGTYSGNGTDNRNITGFGTGATPSLVMIKNATSATAANRNPVMATTHSYGDYSSYISSATANAVNMIQSMSANTFQVGTSNMVNLSGSTIYWMAWGGAPALPAGSGTYQMASGTYTGNGATRSITGVGFKPDLVMIKGDTAQQSVFRTALMAGNNTAYLASATTNFTGGVTSLNTDGFSLGTSTAVNSSGITYHWQAFGGAYNPVTRSGASNFMIGAYMGNGIDNRNITDSSTQPDMVAAKRRGATAGVWRSTANTGDQSSFFANTAEAANQIQTLQSTGFQVGTAANVNTVANLYFWFGFKTGLDFTVGSYTGTGAAQNITGPGLDPDLVWVKRSTNQQGVLRPVDLAGNSTQYFANTANFADGITSMNCNGFSVTGTTAMTNASGGIYRYATWRSPSAELSVDLIDGNGCSVASPTVSLSAIDSSFNCNLTTGTLGIASQKLRILNRLGSPNWSVSIAATSGNTSLWSNGGSTYDYNDSTGSPPGCSDGLDGDSVGGQLTINPSSASVSPVSFCSSSGLSLGAQASYQQGSIDSITLASANSAGVGCYWDITGIAMSQRIPAERPSGTYAQNLTITVVAN